MSKVWKIGTRWSDEGDYSSSVLSIMRRNNIAFVWLEGSEKKILVFCKKRRLYSIRRWLSDSCYWESNM